MPDTRVTKRYLRVRSSIALGIVLIAATVAMLVGMVGRESVATRTMNTTSIDSVMLDLSELSLAFHELRDMDWSSRDQSSRGQVRRAAYSAQKSYEELSQPWRLATFSDGAQSILHQETLNPLLELQEVLFLAELVVQSDAQDLNIERASAMAADLSMRLLPIFGRVRQVEMQAGQAAADRLLLHGFIAIVIMLCGVFVAFRFVHLPMERYVISSQAELAQSRRSAEAASEAKSMFLATMSHEIRTPLNGVLGLADVLGETPLDKEQRRLLSMMSRSGQALLRLINDVLDLAKIDAGKLTLTYADFDLQALCHETKDLFSGQAAKKAITIEVVPQEVAGGWTVHGAPNALRQILANLVGNAIKFTQGGVVSILLEDVVPDQSVDDTEGVRLVRLTVRDQGIGIAPDACERIFEQFEQADASTTTEFGGTGLGLAIVKRLAEAMDGQVALSSVVNEGSEFSVTFPVSQVQRMATETPRVVKDNFAKRVLVADDNQVNRLVAEKLLHTLGCEVATAANGLEAVEMTQSWQPDMVLMDVRMPMMDGLQATREIRDMQSAAEAAQVLIIGLSANAQSAQEEECCEAGMDGYLEKPISRSALCEELSRHWPTVGACAEVTEKCA